LGLPSSIIKSYAQENLEWPWAKEPPQNFGFSYNISATAGANHFKFGAHMGFDKAHHIITQRRNGERGPGLGELPKIWSFPFDIYTMARASDFKFGAQLGFAKAHRTTTPRKKLGVALCYGSFFHIFGVPFNITASVPLRISVFQSLPIQVVVIFAQQHMETC